VASGTTFAVTTDSPKTIAETKVEEVVVNETPKVTPPPVPSKASAPVVDPNKNTIVVPQATKKIAS